MAEIYRRRGRRSRAEREEIEREALARATGSQSVANEAACIREFSERGIPEEEIIPRVNVLTFNAWKASGRYVRRGEHGVKLTVWVPVKSDDESEEPRKRPVSAVVFHISQTEPLS